MYDPIGGLFMRFIKYGLISIFAVFLFSVCAFAADEPVVATVNGAPYTSVAAALADAQAGDRVDVVADCVIDSGCYIKSDVNFYVPSPVTVTFSGNGFINSYGNCRLSGSFISSEFSTVQFIEFFSGTSVITGNFYNYTASHNSGRAIAVDGDANVSIYGGSFHGYRNALRVFNSPSVSIYGGKFTSVEGAPIDSLSAIEYPSGVSSFSEDGSLIFSWGPLYQITQLVTSAISWLVLFVGAIVSNKLLLIWLIVVFVGLGIGLIKRVVQS